MIDKIKSIFSKILNFKIDFRFKVEDNLTINLPTCYTLDTGVIVGRVVDDIKSQTLKIIESEPKFKKRLIKSSKLLVNFEIKKYSLKQKQGHPPLHSPLLICPRWPRNIWLYYSDGQLYDVDGQDRHLWQREQKLKELLGE